jgi:predicted phage replisome organizer
MNVTNVNDSNMIQIGSLTTMFDDEKIRLIESMPDRDTILVIWIKILTQAGKCNATGCLLLNENIPYTDEMLSTIFDRPLNTIRMALEVFKNFGMIELNANVIYVSNWEKHQNLEGMEKIRQQTKARVAKFRENKQQRLNSGNCNAFSNVTVTQCNATDIDIDIEKENNIYSHKSEEIIISELLFEKMRINNQEMYEDLIKEVMKPWRVFKNPDYDYLEELFGD